MKHRADGERQPGVNWGPFTLRIPFYHFRGEWPEFVQGLVVAGATGLALIPILTGLFNVDFEVALAVVVIQGILLSCAPLVFGDPYCHGWVTPGIPLVMAGLGTYRKELTAAALRSGISVDVNTMVIQAATAFTFLCAALFLLLGISGIGRIIVRKVPRGIKAGIILGAAIEAFRREFTLPEGSKFSEAIFEAVPNGKSFFFRAPISCSVALAICLLLMFSLPIGKLKARYGWVAMMAGLGLAPGFIASMFVGLFTGEMTYDVQWGIHVPPFEQMFQELSPFSSQIGFPPFEMYVQMLPLALVIYLIAFGDMVTGNELLHEASKHRPDEKIDINPTRTHLSMGIRNTIQGLLCGPFPCVQGTLWTGVQVVVTHRYKMGRKAMDSIFGGISAYYLWGFPFLFFLTPVITLLKPALPVALSLTLVLTGYACGYIAMSIPRNPVERGIALATGMTLALWGAWQGLLVSILMTVFLMGDEALKELRAPSTD